MQPSSSKQHAYPSGLTPGAQADASVGASRGKFRFKPFKLRKSRAKTVPPQTPQQTTSLPSPVATPAPILESQCDASPRFSVSPTISLPSPTWRRDLSQARELQPAFQTLETPAQEEDTTPSHTRSSPRAFTHAQRTGALSASPLVGDHAFTFQAVPPPTPYSPEGHSALPSTPYESSIDYNAVSAVVPRLRKQQRTAQDKLNEVVGAMTSNDVSLISLILALLDPANTLHEGYRARFYRGGDDTVHRLLDVLCKHANGRAAIRSWTKERAVELVCDLVHDEMEDAKQKLHMQSSEVTADYLKSWDLTSLSTSISTPVFTAVLGAATENDKALRKNVARTPTIAQRIITLQCHHVRSLQSARMQYMLAIYFWAEGCPRQMLEFLSRCSLSASYTTTINAIEQLSRSSVERATDLVAFGPHAFGYDNVNISMSEHVEQRPGAPPKVQSGTFGIICELRGRPPREHLLLAPMKQNLETATDLTIDDITPSLDQSRALLHQFKVIIMRVLTTYHEGFQDHAISPALRHQPRRPLSHTKKNVFHPLPISTIGEGTITGNLQYHDHVYLEQLQQTVDDDHDNLCKYAIPLYADLHTIHCTRSGQHRRIGDINAWTSRGVFQLAFGAFHMVMNLIWALRKTHLGTISQLGSLCHFFQAILDKVRLGRERPDYHTLLAALQQIRDGIILEAWRRECGSDSLDTFARSQPLETDLLAKAEEILIKYAMPVDTTDPDYRPDAVHENIRLLLRDLLYVAELTRAISDGDFGRVEDTLPDIARLFRGAGYNNYASEMIHFIYSIKKVWTPEFANIIRDNMLVNVSGLPHHWMPCDMNVEHHVGYIKRLFAAKGVHSNWDRLGNASGAVAVLMDLKKLVNDQFGLSYKSRTHTTPDTSALVRRVAQDVRDKKMLENIPTREANNSTDHVKDLHAAGNAAFASSTLNTFNARMNAFKSGSAMEEGNEEDHSEEPAYGSVLPGQDDEDD